MPSYPSPPQKRPDVGRKIKEGLCVVAFAFAGAYLLVHGHDGAGTVCLVCAIIAW